MIERGLHQGVKRLVFKPLNNRPFLHGETEPRIPGRIPGLGAYFSEPNDALADQLLDEQLEDGGWNCEAPKSRRSATGEAARNQFDHTLHSEFSLAKIRARR
jgi:hypothetical protein